MKVTLFFYFFPYFYNVYDYINVPLRTKLTLRFILFNNDRLGRS